MDETVLVSKTFHYTYSKNHRTQQEDVLQSNICQKLFTKKSNIEPPINTHQQIPKSYYTCDDCDKVYSTPRIFSSTFLLPFSGMDVQRCHAIIMEISSFSRMLRNIFHTFIVETIVLCFILLILQYDDSKNFDALLKNCRVKQAIFEEVQNTYGLTSMKLLKAAVTRWSKVVAATFCQFVL